MKLNLLKQFQINSLPQGRHSDGGNLYLDVKESGARAWVFRYKIEGKVKELGLGAVHSRSLAEARALATKMRSAILNGIDPKSSRPGRHSIKKTFADYAEEYINNKKSTWKNKKHAQQWANTIRDYVIPVIGQLGASEINLHHVKEILVPIWEVKNETANRVRMRIEAILDYAYLHENLNTANPARWKGYLDKVFNAPSKIREVTGFVALPHKQLPNVMSVLRGKTSISSYCLRWIILTIARSNEARSAQWNEINFENKLWVIPGHKMKRGITHRVPLASECFEILEALRPLKRSEDSYIFPSNTSKSGTLSDIPLSKTFKDVAGDKLVTVHGIRSGFKSWAHEIEEYVIPNMPEVTKAVLAHRLVEDETELAYLRSDLYAKRLKLLDKWEDYLDGSL